MPVKHFFFLLFFLLFHILSAQTDPPKLAEDKTFELFDLEKEPRFPGGEAAMMQYLGENIQYPALARENGIQGTVVLTFVIDKVGNVTDVRVVKDIGGGCGKESVRVVEAMPKWTPGEANGKPVKVRYTLPLRFKFEEDSAPPPLEELGPVTRDEMWILVSEAAQKAYDAKAPVERATPFSLKTLNDKKLLMTLELAFEVKLSVADSKGFKAIGEVSDYFYKAQFAPRFFTRTSFGGKSAKILSSRSDFDTNADGMGKIGSLKVPQGMRLVLYSQKNFKGKKLEINAQSESIEIPNMSEMQAEKGKIKDGGKGVNWGVNTQSVKIILPKGFPEGE